MAVYVKVGHITSRTSAGSQAYTGVGFQPKAVIFWGVNTAISIPEFNDFNYWSFGWTDGTTHLATTSISFVGQGTSE